MQIISLSTGNVRGKRARRGPRRYLPGGWSAELKPVQVFVITHPMGICLFDAGQTARAAEPGYLPRWHPYLRLARFELTAADEVAAQLKALGIEPEDVRWVLLSHLHTDHVGGLEAFGSAKVLVSRIEWERATGLPGRLRGYLPQHWPADLTPTLVDLQGRPLGPFSASLDLAGDGRLVVLGAPGHTPGHLALLARCDRGTYLCAGDMAEQATDLFRVAPRVAQFCRREGITVLTSHDPRAAELASAAPAAGVSEHSG